MNTKTVKKLRKFLGYHPSQKRIYATITTKKKDMKKGIVLDFNCLVIDSSDLRYKYQQMKKEYLR